MDEETECFLGELFL